MVTGEAPVRPQSVRARSDDVPGVEVGRLGGALVVWMGPAMLVVSSVIAISTTTFWLERDRVVLSLLVCAAILAVRAGLELTLARRGRGGATMGVLYAVHGGLLLWALVLNPLMCIYGFMGYVDAPRMLRGRAVAAVIVVTALVLPIGQIGGLDVAMTAPIQLAGLMAVNLTLAGAMTIIDGERSRILAQREEAVARLHRAQRENERLQGQLLERARRTGADEERARLSREIHDTVAQGLIGVIRQLEVAREESGPGDGHRLQLAEESARDCLLEARRAVKALGPHQLAEGTVVEAIGALVSRWARTHRVVATFDADHAPPPGRHGDVLVRITQEALANIARHAGASGVHVTLVGEGAHQVLRIADDGAGFDAAAVRRGHGLDNMQRRAQDADGSLEIDAAPGEGCVVTARVPL